MKKLTYIHTIIIGEDNRDKHVKNLIILNGIKRMEVYQSIIVSNSYFIIQAMLHLIGFALNFFIFL